MNEPKFNIDDKVTLIGRVTRISLDSPDSEWKYSIAVDGQSMEDRKMGIEPKVFEGFLEMRG